jgi:hypothetical protein
MAEGPAIQAAKIAQIEFFNSIQEFCNESHPLIPLRFLRA